MQLHTEPGIISISKLEYFKNIFSVAALKGIMSRIHGSTSVLVTTSIGCR